MTIDAPAREDITGVILAGGLARRMGGQDKGLLRLDGRPLVSWTIEALKPQVQTLLINANRNRERYLEYGYPVVADRLADFRGPLAGIASALAAVATDWIAVVPCDAPYPAPDLVARLGLALAQSDARLALAHDGTRRQPLHALIPRALCASLESFLTSGGRKVDDWYGLHRTAIADFSDRSGCFVNLNSMEDTQRLRREMR